MQASGGRGSTTWFEISGFHGEYADAQAPADLEREVRRLVDPGSARETLYWGRNYLYTAEYAAAGGERREVVVKQFRNQGLRQRLRRRWRGSKAASSWRAALAMVEAGVGTPAPVMWIESNDAEGPSFYVCRRSTGFFESRFLFRAIAAGRHEELFPRTEIRGLFAALGRYLRRLHDAGVWHRDLSIGNVLVREAEDAVPPEFLVVDLNRARLGRKLGLWRRTRDLSRLPVLAPRLRAAFLDAYWDRRVAPLSPRSLLFRVSARAFLLKHALKNRSRPLLDRLAGLLRPRRAHVHIPPAPPGAGARDKVVWDHLSDQPHQHAGRLERARTRLADLGAHWRSGTHAVRALPRFYLRYRKLKRQLYTEPVAWGGVGVAIRPWPSKPQELVAALEELGVRHVLLRLHPWQEEHSEEETTARELHRRGFELAFSLPQNRELVRDVARWRGSIEEIAARFVPYGNTFQIGQAVNRSKWGIWSYGEYLDMAAAASEVLRRAGDVVLLGPAVIDFEVHATAQALNLPHPGVHFDVAAHLLYVDRRGAPENRQAGWDTLDKALLVHAIAETGRNSEGRSWITEFNWPLWEGPHSPAGRNVAVDEELQADYLLRYYLIVLGTGLIERAYWWQLIARGYGLIDPADDGGLRRRPAFRTLATLTAQLDGSRFLGPEIAPPPARIYRFERHGAEVLVGWSTGPPVSVRLPPLAGVVGRDGERLPPPLGAEVELTGSPRYFHLAG